MLWPFLFAALFLALVVGVAWTYLREEEEARGLRIISPGIHGVLDYLLGGLLIALPWLLGVAEGGAPMWVPLLLGAGTILYSLCTDYPLGLVPRLPMRTHLLLDGAAAFFLFVSPFLFGFGDEVLNPYLAIGAMEGLVALLTHPAPGAPGAPATAEEAE